MNRFYIRCFSYTLHRKSGHGIICDDSFDDEIVLDASWPIIIWFDMYPQYHNMIPLVLYLNHHYDFYRTVKIISGIITMIYSAVNHSYDSARTIKIIPGIITMIYSAVNDSYDSDRTIKIISGIITMIYSAVNDSYDSNRTTRIISGIIPFIGRFIHG